MRKKIWMWLRSGAIEGEIFPKHLLVAKAILFPVKFFYYKMGLLMGYQFDTGIWIINGVKYSDEFFDIIQNSDGKLYRITRKNKITIFECVE